MKLTGKAKEKFREWYLNCYLDMRKDTKVLRDLAMGEFLDKHKSEQFGVYQDWGDSLGIALDVKTNYDFGNRNGYWWIVLDDSVKNTTIRQKWHWEETRPQARTEAVKCLNKIVNDEK